MGKKLIIVGDDKQVSPMAVGTDTDKMSALEQMYLHDKIPNSHLYNAKTSIYDIATTTFQPLMLREHFRCVPEIIGFSNMLSYDYKIKPLRDASSSTLLPAVVNYRVADGQRMGRFKTNPKEAEAIVALMKACMEQDEYQGKTFGVISLLGDEQVKIIQREIEQEIDAKEIVSRNILCGNSANFQGDERDVVFLSLVDSGDGTGPLSMMGFGVDDAMRKRYNVAASRARDQLWVVHSLDAANDLKPGDMRKRLIDYAANLMRWMFSIPKSKRIPNRRLNWQSLRTFLIVGITLSSNGRSVRIVWIWSRCVVKRWWLSNVMANVGTAAKKKSGRIWNDRQFWKDWAGASFGFVAASIIALQRKRWNVLFPNLQLLVLSRKLLKAATAANNAPLNC